MSYLGLVEVNAHSRDLIGLLGCGLLDSAQLGSPEVSGAREQGI